MYICVCIYIYVYYIYIIYISVVRLRVFFYTNFIEFKMQFLEDELFPNFSKVLKPLLIHGTYIYIYIHIHITIYVYNWRDQFTTCKFFLS